VIDAGAPVPGIDVDATETDAQGRFEFVVEEPGDVEIQVGPRKDGMEWTTSRRIAGSSDEVLDLILPSGTISGVARTKEDRLLQGARVAAWSEPGGRAPGAWIAHGTVTTDAAGRFSFRNLPAGRCVITSLVEGGIPLRTQVVLGEAARIDDLVLRFP
jgi:hypothetical protein